MNEGEKTEEALETVLVLAVKSNLAPEEALLKLKRLLENQRISFEILGLRTATNSDITETLHLFLLNNQGEFLNQARQAVHSADVDRGLKDEDIPHATPDVLIWFLKNKHTLKPKGLDYYWQALILQEILKCNLGVNKQVLMAFVDMISDENSRMGPAWDPTYAELILNHSQADEAVIWAIIKSPFLTVANKAIPYANNEMLDWVEQNIPTSQQRYKLIGMRRQELSAANT